MIFKFTDEEQAIIKDFEQKAIKSYPGVDIADIFDNLIEDVIQELDGEELKVKIIENPENKQIADDLRNKFNSLIEQMEQKRFEALKTQSDILDDALTTVNDSIIFTYNYLNLPKWNNDSISRPIIINDFGYTAYNYCCYVFKHGSQALFDCAIEKKLSSIRALLDGKTHKNFLIEEALKNHIKRLSENTSALKQLHNLIDKILESSKYIDNAVTRHTKKEMILDRNYDVAMANKLINCTVNPFNATELKILRLAIMQSSMKDTELYEYEISAQELANFFNINVKNLYTHMKEMIAHFHSPVMMEDETTHKISSQSWVDHCDYDNGTLTIKLAYGLKPYLLGLKGCFSTIKIEEYISYKSKHTIIIRELLESKTQGEKPHGNVSVKVAISIDELKRVTNTAKEYEKLSRFRAKVLDVAIKEINESSLNTHISIEPYKNGRSVEGYYFILESSSRYAAMRNQNLIPVISGKKSKAKTKEKEQPQQLTLKDIYDQEF